MASWVTVVLPGGGYGPLGAAIRLPVLALESAGADTVAVEYAGSPFGGASEPEGSEFHRAVREQVAAAAAGARRVSFVAKSLGTLALAALDPDVVASAAVEAIWLTPLFGRPEVRDGAVDRAWRSLLVAGGADGYHDERQHRAVAEAVGARSLVLAGADHRLEVRGDALATVDRLRLLTEAVIGFVGRAPAGAPG